MNIFAIVLITLFLPQARPASIEGVVLRGGTSEPVSRAVVELKSDRLAQPMAMATAADGKFQFGNLAPGRYRITVTRTGFLPGSYGQRGPNGTGTELVIEAGQSLRDIRLSIIATGAISGRVYDNAGEPLANVPVQALKYAYLDGRRTLSTVKADVTDDRGEYRLFWLPPGVYYVRAVPQGGPGTGNDFTIMMHESGQRGVRFAFDSNGTIRSADPSIAERLGEADVPVYYPGTVEAQAAVPVELRSGADLGRVDFSLSRVKTRRVRGVLMDGVTGEPARFASVTLVPRFPSSSGSQNGRVSSDGTFDIQGVLPGSYFLVANNRATQGGGAVRLVGARVPIDVGAADLDNVSVVMTPSVDIRGEVVFEGPGAGDYHPVVALRNDLTNVPGRQAQAYASFSDNRQFVINDVIEGEYRVELSDLVKGAYVKSIRFGSTDVQSENLRVDSRTSGSLEVVLSTNAGTIEGTVLNRNREPLANVPVTLVPDASRRQRAGLYKGTYTDDAGRFQLQAVPPGVYSIFAWEDIDEATWRDPDFIRRNEASGKAIRISEDSRETIELTAIPYAF
jgi:hypothetical protein